jgi:hypothetical protein
MPEMLFFNTVRYLNELHEKNKLSQEQIKKLAEFVIELTAETEKKSAVKTDSPKKQTQFLDIETTRILRDVIPELRDALGHTRDGALILT